MKQDGQLKIAVIGGGAAGMMAAVFAGESGAQVTILEHKDRIGKKILSTGNGKCNLTNMNQEPEHYRGENPSFAQRIIQQFSVQDTIAFFASLGIYTKNKNGGLYPYSEQASAVLDVLRMEIDALGIEINTGVTIEAIKPMQTGFEIKTQEGMRKYDKVIIATGSKAAPITGSDGSGYLLADKLGHHIIKPLPALVQLRSPQAFFKSIAGVRWDAALKLICDDETVCEETGELQLTDYGISGIPVFQLSRYAAKALDRRQKVAVIIDFMPDFTEALLIEFIQKRIEACPYKTIEESLVGLLHKKLIAFLLREKHLKGNTKTKNVSINEVKGLVNGIKHTAVEICGTNSFEQAQTCSGGVDTTQLTDNLESTIVKDLYFAGEIIDIDGACGGYNLQWAWSTGFVAGTHAALGKE